MQRDVQLTVIGKVFKPNSNKVLALNRALKEYSRLVGWYFSFNSTSKTFLHENGYERGKRLTLKYGPPKFYLTVLFWLVC